MRGWSGALGIVIGVLLNWASLGLAHHGGIHYVSTSGNNNNSCTTAQTCTSPTCTTAKRTVQNAVNNCLLGPGDTVYMRQGTYHEGIDFPLLFGTSTNPITLGGAPGDARPILQPPSSRNTSGIDIPWDSQRRQQWLILRDFDIEQIDAVDSGLGFHCINSFGRKVTLDNLEMRNCVRQAVEAKGPDFTIRNSRIINCGRIQPTTEDTKGIGVHFAPDDTAPNGGQGGNGLAEFNVIDGCRGGGIDSFYTASDNVTIRYNIIRNFGDSSPWPQAPPPAEDQQGTGIYIGGVSAPSYPTPAQNTRVYNNIIYNAVGQDNTCLGIWRAQSGWLVNNTCYNVDYGWDALGTSTGVTIQNNIFANVGALTNVPGAVTGTISNNLLNPTVSTLFVNAAAGNFHLAATATVAIDQGVNTASIGVTQDFDGNARPQGSAFDIGAYEFDSTPATPVTLTAAPTQLTGPQNVLVSWANVPTTAADQWIALFVVGSPDWQYVQDQWWWMSSCTQTLGASTPASGQCSVLVAQDPGQYEFRAFANPAGTVVHDTSETITITAGTLPTRPFLMLRQ